MRWLVFVLALVAISLVVFACYPAPNASPTEVVEVIIPWDFDSARAMDDLEYQVSLGPRIPGSEAHARLIEWVMEELDKYGWDTHLQEGVYQGKTIRNIIAKRGEGSPWIILGAHYDSRLLADNDPDPENRETPVPGGNDGASGVAVLMEIGRVLPAELDKTIWIVFFDAEDNGRILDWDWILGSRYFVESLEGLPDAAVIVDMVGDSELTIYQERNSDEELVNQIWRLATDLGYSQFIPTYKHRILDDHVPFLEAGIPAVDIIDIEYPYYHTTQDTADKNSVSSLQAVGDTVLAWLKQP